MFSHHRFAPCDFAPTVSRLLQKRMKSGANRGQSFCDGGRGERSDELD